MKRDPDLYLQRLDDFELGLSTTNFQQLKEAGVVLPEPEAMDDKALTAKLWEVIAALARIRVFITSTDHLSDRELYADLFHRILREEVPDLSDTAGVSHVDILGGWSEADTQLFLKYYADDEWREDWSTKFPDLVMPPHEDPPYDRDRDLPKPYVELSHKPRSSSRSRAARRRRTHKGCAGSS
jgi:hypothetical protein